MIRLRQVVLVARDLRGAVAEVRAALGLEPGVVHDMSHLGLAHEVLTVGDTFVEVVSPLDPDADDPASRTLRRSGPGGYMVVLQVDDIDAVVDRAGRHSIRVVHEGALDGARFAQFHPKDVATLLETDQVEPWESWHFAPEIFTRRRLDVSLGVVGATVAVADPGHVASKWSALLGVARTGAHMLELDGGRIEFVAAADRHGLVAIDVVAADPSRAGTSEACGGITLNWHESS